MACIVSPLSRAPDGAREVLGWRKHSVLMRRRRPRFCGELPQRLAAWANPFSCVRAKQCSKYWSFTALI